MGYQQTTAFEINGAQALQYSKQFWETYTTFVSHCF